MPELRRGWTVLEGTVGVLYIAGSPIAFLSVEENKYILNSSKFNIDRFIVHAHSFSEAQEKIENILHTYISTSIVEYMTIANGLINKTY